MITTSSPKKPDAKPNIVIATPLPIASLLRALSNSSPSPFLSVVYNLSNLIVLSKTSLIILVGVLKKGTITFKNGFCIIF